MLQAPDGLVLMHTLSKVSERDRRPFAWHLLDRSWELM